MKNLKKSHWILIIVSVLILLGCIGITVYLLFSNYQNIRLFKQAQSNFQRGDDDSLTLAESQLLQFVRKDNDNEAAYIMLGQIAEKRKCYPEQVYYCYMAHRLNPLSSENKERYIKSLWFARYFDRLESFLSLQSSLSDEENQILYYSAGRNGNLNKYKIQLQRRDNNAIAELALLMFKYDHLSTAQKVVALDKIKENDWVKQEILAAKMELYLSTGDIDNAEKALKEAYELNTAAFAPALGRFYANYRSLGQSLTVYEKHLSIYHDPVIALQLAEIYCMLKRSDDLAKLRAQYQADAGNQAMLLCYYFDALKAYANNDLSSLKEFLAPLRKNINTSLSRFLFFCADVQENNLSAILEGYKSLLSNHNYPGLQSHADEILSQYLRSSLSFAAGKEEQLQQLAVLLYERKKEVFTAKFILLFQKKRNNINFTLLKDAVNRFKQDQGIIKIAIEYFLVHDLAECGRLIGYYKQTFPKRSSDMLRYEIVLALRKKDYDKASELFRKDSSPVVMAEYWNFASSMMREKDLVFLSRNKMYEPFCKALLFMKKGNKVAACDLLEQADAQNNLQLLFFAAKTLAENGRNDAALKKYALFPEKSSYQLDVLLNTAELLAEKGNIDRAVEVSGKAYQLAPDFSEAQLCYADKLFRRGNLIKIPDVIKLKSNTPLRKRMAQLWVAGMRQRIKESDLQSQRERTRELCRQLLAVSPDDDIALEYLKTLNKMSQ